MISPTQLRYICPSLPQDRANIIAPLLDSICPKYGIDTPDKFHEFIARLPVECKGFTVFTEGLNYLPEALVNTFGLHRITREQAALYGRLQIGKTIKRPAGQKAIANLVYGGEWGKENLGNTQQGDGWMFRGGGMCQNTGRKMYEDFTKFYNSKFGTSLTSEQMTELLRTNLEVTVHNACWLFAIVKKLIQIAIDDNLELIVKKWNGGNIGLPETKQYYERAKKIII